MSPRELSKAVAFLKDEPYLGPFVARIARPKFTAGQDPFQALVRSIVYQQISGKAAASILRKFQALFPRKKITPKKLLQFSDAEMRTAGLSSQKIVYLRDLATKFLNGIIDPSRFPEMTDEAIREHLIAVKGIGRWTADMFLMFTLHRPDVLPTGDLAIQKGMQKVFCLRTVPNVKKMNDLARVWQPYRTIASMYVWRAIDEGESEW